GPVHLTQLRTELEPLYDALRVARRRGRRHRDRRLRLAEVMLGHLATAGDIDLLSLVEHLDQFFSISPAPQLPLQRARQTIAVHPRIHRLGAPATLDGLELSGVEALGDAPDILDQAADRGLGPLLLDLPADLEQADARIAIVRTDVDAVGGPRMAQRSG